MSDDDMNSHSQRELELVRFQLREADRRLAESEAEVVRLRRENAALRGKAVNAQEQVRRLRHSPAWRTAESLLVLEHRVRRVGGSLSEQLHQIKRKVIG